MPIPNKMNPLGLSPESASPYFELTVQPGILSDGMTYGFCPFWNTGGGCTIVDWGDGTGGEASVSGQTVTHTYQEAGIYTIRLMADCYRIRFGYESNYPGLISHCNGNWNALGTITDGSSMFRGCVNGEFDFCNLPEHLTKAQDMFQNCGKSLLPLKELPSGLTNGRSMFLNCSSAQLNLRTLPSGLTECYGMFQNCSAAGLNFSALPAGIKSGAYMFYFCKNAVMNLTQLAENAPHDGWKSLSSIESMFRGDTKVSGSRSAFLAKCPPGIPDSYAFSQTGTTE